MTHALDFSKGHAAIAYRGQVPWHGYGLRIDEDLPPERWIELAGLDYDVVKRPVHTVGLDGSHVSVPKRRVLLRSDNNQPLSVVADSYKVVQPREVVEFFRDLVDASGFKLHTAGALADGKRVWALAETGKEFRIPGSWDELQAYLLLATSYDGKFATTAQFTSVRVVCDNTLQFSLNRANDDAQRVIRVPHMTTFDADKVKAELGLIDGAFRQFQDDVIKLSEVNIGRKQAIEFFMDLMDVEEAAEDVDRKQTFNVKKLLEAYTSAPDQELPTARNTLWGVTKAVSYFADHSRRARNQGTRLDSAWFGQSARLKEKAFSRALELADAS